MYSFENRCNNLVIAVTSGSMRAKKNKNQNTPNDYYSDKKYLFNRLLSLFLFLQI